jgi:hypothetical protein
MGNEIKIDNLREYRPDGPTGVYAIDFEYVCPKCGVRHKAGARQADPIMVVPVAAPCGFTTSVAMPELELE